MSETPDGFCQCGCGGKTNMIQKNHTRKGYVKGKYYKFLPQHHSKDQCQGEGNPNWKGGFSQKFNPKASAEYSSKRYKRKKAEKLGCDMENLPKYAPRDCKSFDERLEKQGECLVWTGSKNQQGYGKYSARSKKSVAAHRFAWERVHGLIPEGMVICHKCDNPPCCNPNHLFLGTTLDNNRDCIAKGRKASQKGDLASAAKVTEQQVREIREKFADGGVMKKELAAEYGLKPSAVSLIISRKNWSHVE